MFTIIWDYIDNGGHAHLNNRLEFVDRDEANRIWQEMKNDGRYSNMRAEKTGDSKKVVAAPKPVVQKQTEAKPEEKFIVVQVRFNDNGKLYTYLAKSKVNAGDTVVVWSDGYQLLKVVDCKENVSKSELEKICAIEKFQYIKGKVIAA